MRTTKEILINKATILINRINNSKLIFNKQLDDFIVKINLELTNADTELNKLKTNNKFHTNSELTYNALNKGINTINIAIDALIITTNTLTINANYEKTTYNNQLNNILKPVFRILDRLNNNILEYFDKAIDKAESNFEKLNTTNANRNKMVLNKLSAFN